MVVAIVKKNNKVKFKIQGQGSLGPSKPLLSTTLPPVQWANPALPLGLAGQWFLVWPPDSAGQSRKSVNTLKSLIYQKKRVRMRSGFSPLMWDVNLKVVSYENDKNKLKY